MRFGLKRSVIALLGSLLCTAALAQTVLVDEVTDPVEWVNPLMGTDSKHSLSNGNTYPAIALPGGPRDPSA